MASSNLDSKTNIATLRNEILSYKPGKAVSCDDDRVVFPDKLVVGIMDFYQYEYASVIVDALRRAFHGDTKPSKHADYLTDSISVITRTCHDLNDLGIIQDLAGKVECIVLSVRPYDIEIYPEWIKEIKRITGRVPLCAILSSGDIAKAIHELKHLGITDMYKIPLQTPFTGPIRSHEDQSQLLDLLRGCLREGDRKLAANDLKKICANPRCKLLYENTKKEAKEAKQKMFTDFKEQKQELTNGREQDRANFEMNLESKEHQVDTLTEIVGEQRRNETVLRHQVDELKKGRERDTLRAETEKRSLAADTTMNLESKQHQVDTLTEIVGEKRRNETVLRHQVEELEKGRERDIARFEKDKQLIESSWKKKHDFDLEQLKRETWKLRTKIQLESEIRSAEQTKKKAETNRSSFIPWVTSGNQAQSDASLSEDNSIGERGRSDSIQTGEEPPNDEFAGILRQIADALYDEAKIDSLAGQLGILHGDIQRALMTNVKFNRVTSEGTLHMLKQWRRGVLREDERIELTKALQAAKLVDLADQYLSEKNV